VKGIWGHRWIAPTQPELQRVDRLTQARWRFGLVLKAQGLDVIEQDVGLGEQRPPARLSSGFGRGINGRGGHAEQHKHYCGFVKWTFTAFCFLTTWVEAARTQ
jgi:hypothetical protein